MKEVVAREALGINVSASHHNVFDRSKEELEAELADAILMQRISTGLIREDGTTGLYNKLVSAAKAIMRSQYATMQMLYPDPGKIGKLRLLAASGFTEEAEKYWEWVYSNTGSSCGAGLRAGKRVIIDNFATCEFMQNEPTLPIFLDAGIYAAQSTPLYSRSGKLLGMISTHWTYPHRPSDRHLQLLDILARQAADLIERTQTEEALKESEGRLLALTRATSDVVYHMSADWKQMYNLDGRNFLDSTGKPDANWLEKYILPIDHEKVMTAIKNAIDKKHIFQLEHRILKADGTVGWTFSRAIPILDNKGNIVEWFGAASDITDKQKLMTQLEDLVNERTRELHRSNDDLQQFAHVASHDLKEPVRKITTFGLRLKEELNGANEKAAIYTEKILESASRMTTMIEGVLSYASYGAVDEEIEKLNLNAIVTDIQNDLELLMDQKRAIVHCDPLPEIEGIKVLVYQVFYNIINNSLKFSREDLNPLIRITARACNELDGNYTTVTISDNGIGFDPIHSDLIFDTFARLNSKDRYDGTGLGLALVKKIVERHHGHIQATGSKNEGASFMITFPLTQPC